MNTQINICEHCTKTYKKTHNCQKKRIFESKQKLQQISEEQIQVAIIAAEPEIIEVISEPVVEEIDQDGEMTDDEIQYDQLIYESDHSIPDICEKCGVAKTCQNCEIQVTETQQMTINYGYTSAVIRPFQPKNANKIQGKLLDLWFHNSSVYAIDEKMQFLCLNNAPILNQYESELINPNVRVTHGQPKLIAKRSMFDYQFDKKGEFTKFGCKNDKLMISKIIIENNIEFAENRPDVVYHDIETFTTHKSANFGSVPLSTDKYAHISMLCATHVKAAGTVQIHVFILDCYNTSISSIQAALRGHIDIDVEIMIHECHDDKHLAVKYFVWLQSIKNQVICCGYNASQGKSVEYQKLPETYDLVWLMNRAGIPKEDASTIGSKWLNQASDKAISRLRQLPLVIFLDFKQLVHDTLKMNEAALEGQKLDHILAYLGIPTKIDVNFAQMNADSNTIGFDMSYYAAYCAYDTLCLHLANQKHDLIEFQKEICSMQQFPFTFQASFSNAQKSMFDYFKRAFLSGHSFTYQYFDKLENTAKKWGAFTRTAPQEYQCRVINNVFAADFESQYPNAILQCNISPESVVDFSHNVVDINFGHGDEQLVYFSENEAILPGMVRKFIELKKEYKKTGQTTREKAIKIIVNTIYGLINQDSNPLFNYNCGSAVTAFARKTIDVAMQLYTNAECNIMTVDTDGLEIVPPKHVNPIDMIPFMKEIADKITTRWPRMILVIEKPKTFLFGANKKQYIKADVDKIEMKGIGSRIKLQMTARQLLEENMKWLMRQPIENRNDLAAAIFNIKSDYTMRIYESISAKTLDWCAFNVKTTKTHNSRGQLSKCGKLAERFGAMGSYKTIPYNFGDVRDDFNHTISSSIPDVKNIKINAIIEQLMQPFSMLLGKNKTVNVGLGESKNMYRFERGLIQKTNMILDADQLISYMDKNKNDAIHEVISGASKLVFDLDCHDQDVPYDQFKTALIKSIGVCQIHVAKSSGKDNVGYHVVCDVLMEKSQQLAIALYINKTLNLNVCDIALYDKNHQLRIPHCPKYTNGRLIPGREYKIVTRSSIKDFIVQNWTDSCIDKRYSIAFANVEATTTQHAKIETESQLKIIDWIKRTAGLDYVFQNDQSLNCTTIEFKCPVSGNQHTKISQYVNAGNLRCFSTQCRGQKVKINEEIKEIPAVVASDPFENEIEQDQELVDYQIDQQSITYIRSAMGTGKTKKLNQIIQGDKYKDKCVIIVSFRKTFSRDFASKNEFYCYMDATESQICLNDHPRIVIQFDSLYKLNTQLVRGSNIILVCDEIESILSQIGAFANKSNNQMSLLKMIDLLQQCDRSVVMDACIQQSTVQLLNRLSNNSNFAVYNNKYQPKRGKTINIINGGKTQSFQAKFTKQVTQTLTNNKKVVVACTSKALAEQLYQSIEKCDKKVLLYTGDDSHRFECHGNQTMATAKAIDFADVNSKWINYDCIIYTSTLTAGISFEQQHFDQFIGYYCAKTCDVLQFIQQMQRVRNFNDDNATIYVDQTQETYEQTTPASIMQYRLDLIGFCPKMNVVDEVQVHVAARQSALKARKQILLHRFLKEQGYDIKSQVTESIASKQGAKMIVNHQVTWDYNMTPEDVNYHIKSKHQSLAMNNDDPLLNTKIVLSKIMHIYGQTLDQFNKLDIKMKMSMYSGITARKLRNWAQSAIDEVFTIRDDTQTQPRWNEMKTTCQTYLRQRNELKKTSENAINRIQIKSYDGMVQQLIGAFDILASVQGQIANDATKIEYFDGVKTQNSKYVNSQIEMLGYTVNSKQIRIGSGQKRSVFELKKIE